MGRSPCCDKSKVKRGTWSPEEDQTLKNYIAKHGTAGNWIALPQKAGLLRCGKSCRLRWLNYLRPDIRHGAFTQEESDIICNLYNKIGSRWSVIASQLQGRTDNDVKNYWNTKIKKKKITKSDNIVIENTNSTFQAISHPDPILPINEYSSSVSNEPVNFDMPAGSSGDFTFSSSHQELTSSRSFGFEADGVNGAPIDEEGFRDYYSYGDLFSIFQC